MRHDTLYKKIKSNSGTPCISLISPIEYKSYDDRETIRKNLIKEITDVTDEMLSNYSRETVEIIKIKLNNIVNNLDYTHLPKGLGIYVSLSCEQQVFFPFTVKKKRIVDHSFDLAEIEELIERDFRFTILIISSKSIRLFEGENTLIREVFDDFFPLCNNNNNNNNNNKGKDSFDHEQVNQYLSQVHKRIEKYKSRNSLIIIIGSIENLNKFKEVTNSSDDIMTEIHGNYDNINLYQVGRLIWPEIETLYMKKKLMQKSKESK